MQKHYKDNKSTGRSTQSKLDFSQSSFSKEEIIERMDDAKIYDVWDKNIHPDKYLYIQSLRHLIYFQDLRYYFAKYRNCLQYKIDYSDLRFIEETGLAGVFCGQVSQITALKDKIEWTKAKFDEDFYYVYARFDEHITGENVPNNPTDLELKHFLEKLEYATKHALHEIGIYTTAGEERIANKATIIDISEINNCLINLTDNILPDFINFI